jgi:hypothetical protein
VRVVYCRCTGGHYFVGPACPLDGWTSNAARQLNHAFTLLVEEGEQASIEMLRKRGCDDAAIGRALVIEYGDPDGVFEAIEPAALIINGERVKLRDLPQRFR